MSEMNTFSNQGIDHVVKMVAVGDGAVGKTCLLNVFVNNGEFPDTYEPTIFENHEFQINHPKNKKCRKSGCHPTTCATVDIPEIVGQVFLRVSFYISLYIYIYIYT